MAPFSPPEVRQLRLFGWFLLIVNACIVAGGLALGGKLDDPAAGRWGMLMLAVVVNAAFVLIVGFDVGVAAMRRWWRAWRRRG